MGWWIISKDPLQTLATACSNVRQEDFGLDSSHRVSYHERALRRKLRMSPVLTKLDWRGHPGSRQQKANEKAHIHGCSRFEKGTKKSYHVLCK